MTSSWYGGRAHLVGLTYTIGQYELAAGIIARTLQLAPAVAQEGGAGTLLEAESS